MNTTNALRGGDQTHHLNVTTAGFLEIANRGTRTAAGGKHRINDNGVALADVVRKLGVIGDRAMRCFVAANTDVPNARLRKQLHHAVSHAQARAQNRHQCDWAAELVAFGLLERCRHADRAGVKSAGDLIGHQTGDLIEQTAKVRGMSATMARYRQLVPNERVIEDLEIGECVRMCGHESVPCGQA